MSRDSGFHARLRQAIAHKGISQTDLAERLGVRIATVNEWLNRRRFPSGAVMLRLPELLGVDGHWLLTGSPGWSQSVTDESDIARLERDRVVALLEVAIGLLRDADGGVVPAPAAEPIGHARPASSREAVALSAVEAFRAGKRSRRTGSL